MFSCIITKISKTNEGNKSEQWNSPELNIQGSLLRFVSSVLSSSVFLESLVQDTWNPLADNVLTRAGCMAVSDSTHSSH